MPPKPPKYNWVQKKKETESIAADYNHKREIIEDDEFEQARIHGREVLNEFDSKIADIRERLEVINYARNFGKDPSSKEIFTLKTEIGERFKQYKTNSEEIADDAARIAEAAKLTQQIARANIQCGMIRPRGAPSPEPLRTELDSTISGRGAPSPAFSTISVTSARFRREPTPQPVPTALPSPPRHPKFSSRQFAHQDNTRTELSVASSSKHFHQAVGDETFYRQGSGHQPSNSLGNSSYPHRFSVDTQNSGQIPEISEEYDEVSKENE